MEAEELFSHSLACGTCCSGYLKTRVSRWGAEQLKVMGRPWHVSEEPRRRFIRPTLILAM